jgi:hypothetical protein
MPRTAARPSPSGATGRLARLVWLLPAAWLVVDRWTALPLAFFWDELGVYGRSVYALLDAGVSPWPSALDPELSRGHPMAYVFGQALLASVFGQGRTTLHAINLGIAVLLLGLVARGTRQATGPSAEGRIWPWALAATAWLAVQPLYRAQATLVLPEMTLALAVAGMLLAYHRGARWSYLLWGLLAVWTKETAVVVPAALLADAVTGGGPREALGGVFARTGETLRSRMASLAWVAAPWAGFAAFLLVQKAQLGWFFFPYHTSLFDLSAPALADKAERFLRFLFLDQERWPLLPLWAASLWAARRPGWARSAWWVVWAWLAFSSTNAYMNRYLLPLLPPLAWLAVAGARTWGAAILPLWRRGDGSTRRGLRALSAPFAIAVLAAPLVYRAEGFAYDETPAVADQVTVTRWATIHALKHRDGADSVAANFPLIYAWGDPRYGYLDGPPPFPRASVAGRADWHYWMSPGSYDHPPDWSRADSVDGHRVGACTAVVFRIRRDTARVP